MTDRDDLADRLDAVEEDLGDTSTAGLAPTIVYTTDDGYETADGDPVPTDANGDPDPVDATEHGVTIILDGQYAPRDGAGARGDT